jgi:hypothetical protein
MAEDHMSQDTSTNTLPKASPSRSLSPAVVAALGFNAALVCAAWPAFLLPEGAVVRASLSLVTAACGTLLMGVIALYLEKLRAARWLLLCGFPATLACAVAVVPEGELEHAHTPVSLVLGALAFLAYAAGCALAVTPPRAVREHEATLLPLAAELPDIPRSPFRAAMLATFVAGAFLIAVVAPLWPAWPRVQAAWGEAAGPGAVLSAVVAGALATSMLALHLTSLLRHADAPPPLTAPERRLQIATLLFVSLLGGVVYFVIT